MYLRNPVLDPSVPPEEWRRYQMRRRWLLRFLGLTVLVLLAGAGSFFMPRDRTEGMSGEEIVRTAGQLILKQDRYRFRALLEGGGSVPTAVMEGRYQRTPLTLHLEGTATSGSKQTLLAYWLEESNLYVRHPQTGEWRLVVGANLDELHSFQPDNIAAPLLHGVQKAQVIGDEMVEGKRAVVMELELDPRVMLPALGTSGTSYPSGVSYRLWVEKTTLLPLRFRMDVGDGSKQTFSYTLEWRFAGAPRLVVPEAVKASAQPL